MRYVTASSFLVPLLKLEQALDYLDPSSLASRRCLRELRSICGSMATLPATYTLSPQCLVIDSMPRISGYSGEVYMGTLDGSKIRIKPVRADSQVILQTTTKVNFISRHPLFPFRPSLTVLRTSAERQWCGNTWTTQMSYPSWASLPIPSNLFQIGYLAGTCGNTSGNIPVRIDLDSWVSPLL